MLVIGAKGFAKEMLEIFHQNNTLKDLVFYDDVNSDIEDKLFGIFKVLKKPEEAIHYFNTVSKAFVIGIGNPLLRYKLSQKFIEFGGELTSVVSPFAKIGYYGIEIGEGANILTDAIITSNIKIGIGCLINKQVMVGHDVVLEDFVELAPGAKIGGHCKIGSYTFVGMNAIILPKVKIGKNVVVASGAVVTKDVLDNCMVAGVPAVIKNEREPLPF
ncbi:MAG: acetyltransferase [Flavobacterium sp.]|nr:acetyltransferase [Flavobacterium sp.]